MYPKELLHPVHDEEEESFFLRLGGIMVARGGQSLRHSGCPWRDFARDYVVCAFDFLDGTKVLGSVGRWGRVAELSTGALALGEVLGPGSPCEWHQSREHATLKSDSLKTRRSVFCQSS